MILVILGIAGREILPAREVEMSVFCPTNQNLLSALSVLLRNEKSFVHIDRASFARPFTEIAIG
jgi:hypothetical protein